MTKVILIVLAVLSFIGVKALVAKTQIHDAGIIVAVESSGGVSGGMGGGGGGKA